MACYLFEVYMSHCHKYFVVDDIDNLVRKRNSFRWRHALTRSTRVWENNEQGIKFIKNRDYDLDKTEVDLQEFIVLRLKAEAITL